MRDWRNRPSRLILRRSRGLPWLIHGAGRNCRSVSRSDWWRNSWWRVAERVNRLQTGYCSRSGRKWGCDSGPLIGIVHLRTFTSRIRVQYRPARSWITGTRLARSRTRRNRRWARHTIRPVTARDPQEPIPRKVEKHENVARSLVPINFHYGLESKLGLRNGK